MTSPLPGEHEFDSPGIDKLRDSAVDAIAWALIDNSMDTADRQPSEEAYRAAVEQARALLPTLVRRSVVSTPSDEERDAREFLAKHYTPAEGWTVDELHLTVLVPQSILMVGNGEALRLVRDILDEAAFDIKVVERSAVSAPPTITDEALARVMHADDVDKGRAFSTFEAMDADTQAWYFDNARAVIAHLAARAALGGEA